MTFDEIRRLIPAAPDWTLDLDAWKSTEFLRCIDMMKSTPQNPEWHAEGDVWTHTAMVCAELVRDGEFRSLCRREQEILFIAAMMHDIGKPKCTAAEDGVITSPHHTAVGAKLAREFLWREWGLCGTREAQAFREAVCALIRYHGALVHLEADGRAERKLIKIASVCELVPDFSLGMLRILVRADNRGRITKDLSTHLEEAEMMFILAEELGIMKGCYPFPDPITGHAYLSGRNVPRDYPLYDDTWQKVILVAGLPGTGKDTWIRENCPELPVISLDGLRREMNISPTDKEAQGSVIARAKEMAKRYLREKRSFVWNATNISAQIRENQLALFEKYHAFTHTVFLETELETGLERNKARSAEVPESVIFDLLAKLEPPLPYEAHSVEWVIT